MGKKTDPASPKQCTPAHIIIISPLPFSFLGHIPVTTNTPKQDSPTPNSRQHSICVFSAPLTLQTLQNSFSLASQTRLSA